MTNQKVKTLRFDNRVAIVTGGGRGIGREQAIFLARRGASVLVNDFGVDTDGTGRSSKPAKQVSEEIQNFGGKAAADFNNAATLKGCAALVEAAVSHFGKIDIVICNAGGARGTWLDMIDLNLSGTLWICEAAWPLLKEQRYGRILTTTSAMGLFGRRGTTVDDAVIFSSFGYGAGKMGTVNLTRSLALEGADDNIKVNGIAPVAASRLTAKSPNPGVAEWMETYFPPHHVATAAACLVHEACPVTGDIFSVGGGRMAKIIVGETQGYYDPQLTPESLMAKIDTVIDEGQVYTPRSANEEMSIYSRIMGTGGPY